MNKADLDRLLKGVRVPERAESYWAEFPRRVSVRLRRQTHGETPRPIASLRPWRLALLGSGALAVLCLVAGLASALWRAGQPASAGRLAFIQKCYSEVEGLFPNQVEAIVFDRTGPQLVLANQPDVPRSTPLYLKIRGPHGTQEVVTFSGQQIRVNGDVCDVLVDGAGAVMLVGQKLLWSSAPAIREPGSYRIEAKILRTSA